MKIQNLFFFGLLFLVFVSTNASAQKRTKPSVKASKETERIVSNDERRKKLEALMLEGKYHHDGSGELMYIGTIESVPALLKVLEANPPALEIIEEEPPTVKKPDEIITLSETPQVRREPKKYYICTYLHAVAALQKITGQNFVDFEDWKKWWDEYLKNKGK